MAMGVRNERLAPIMTFVYACVDVVGIMVGLVVVLTNESEASALLIAVTSGGLGTIATGVAAWMGLTFTPSAPSRVAQSASVPSSLERAPEAGKLISVTKGGWVPVPAECRSAGAPPPSYDVSQKSVAPDAC